MNCRECQNWLQESLDEGRIAVSVEVQAHVAECEACRSDVAAARILLDGLTSFAKPETTKLMTASIAAAVAVDRIDQRRRSTFRWRITATLAASLMAIFLVSMFPRVWGTKPEAVVKVTEPKQQPAVEFTQRTEDAQKAVASLTRSVTETTKSRLSALLPEKGTFAIELPTFPGFDEPLDPAAKSLKTAGLTVAHAFDPVANTTVQAFGFFAREMPVADYSKN